MTTEPNESKSGDGTYPSGTMATFVPPLDPTVGIELRVTRAGMPARRLRINAPRCTFGSGEGCTVRLSDASLRPLHAVILRDNGRIMIRGYSVPLEINGEFVAESFLSLGDVIRLGQYCFEMIDLPLFDADDDAYEDEAIETTHAFSQQGNAAGAKTIKPSKPRHDDDQIAIDEAHSSDPSSNPKRLKFSPPLATPRSSASLRSDSQSLLEGLQVSQSDVDVSGRGDEVVVDQQAVREPVISLAHIHVQAKRNSELMAELAAARQREQDTDDKLAVTVQKLEATQTEVVQATQSNAVLKAEIASLSDQVLKLTSDVQEQQSIATAEQAKLNRAITSLRESGAASQKAEAATRQALQESIRQRDEAFAQRTMAIDTQQLTRAKLEEAEAQIGRIYQEAEETSDLLARFESEAEKSRTRIDELKDVCCSQADQITKLSVLLEASQNSELAAVTRLKNTIDQMQEELDASRQLAKTADIERVQLNTLRTSLDSMLQEHITEKLSWGAQVDRLNQKIETVSAELHSTTNGLTRSRDESTALQSRISELQTQLADVETELSLRPKIEQLQKVQSQLARSESDLENTERQLAQLREDYDQLASQRIAQDPVFNDRLGNQVSKDQTAPLQAQAFTAPLPSPVFPVPVRSDSGHSKDSLVDAKAVSSNDAGVQAHCHKTTLEPQATTGHDESPVSESSWNTPSSDASSPPSGSWNISSFRANEDKPLQPSGSHGDPVHEPETQSQWLTSSHCGTVVMKAEAGEESFHTQPMNRYSEASFTTGDHADADADANNHIEEVISQDSVEDESDVDQESLLAALIERSEGPASNWFADYTSSEPASVNSTEPEEAEDEIGDAIAESEFNGLDPEASALSLARMLINELDSATQIDPDPVVKSKLLVGASISEEGTSQDEETSEDGHQTPPVEMRRKDFDERAFRESFADSADEDVIDPNADEAAYAIATDRPTGNCAAQSSPGIAEEEEEEEDSVEAYMNQLLRRMGQEPATVAKPVEDTVKPAANKFSSTQPQEAKSKTPDVVRPRRPTPELEVPMDQMRELANESAQSAISTSNRKGAKEMRSKAMVDGVQAGVVVACSLVFFYCGMTSSNLSLVWNTAGALAIALSAFFFYEMFRKLTVAMKSA